MFACYEWTTVARFPSRGTEATHSRLPTFFVKRPWNPSSTSNMVASFSRFGEPSNSCSAFQAEGPKQLIPRCRRLSLSGLGNQVLLRTWSLRSLGSETEPQLLGFPSRGTEATHSPLPTFVVKRPWNPSLLRTWSLRSLGSENRATVARLSKPRDRSILLPAADVFSLSGIGTQVLLRTLSHRFSRFGEPSHSCSAFQAEDRSNYFPAADVFR